MNKNDVVDVEEFLGTTDVRFILCRGGSYRGGLVAPKRKRGNECRADCSFVSLNRPGPIGCPV